MPSTAVARLSDRLSARTLLVYLLAAGGVIVVTGNVALVVGLATAFLVVESRQFLIDTPGVDDRWVTVGLAVVVLAISLVWLATELRQPPLLRTLWAPVAAVLGGLWLLLDARVSTASPTRSKPARRPSPRSPPTAISPNARCKRRSNSPAATGRLSVSTIRQLIQPTIRQPTIRQPIQPPARRRRPPMSRPDTPSRRVSSVPPALVGWPSVDSGACFGGWLDRFWARPDWSLPLAECRLKDPLGALVGHIAVNDRLRVVGGQPLPRCC